MRSGISTPLIRPFLLAKTLKNALLETLRLQKASSTQVQIGQSKVHHETVGVLSDATIANFLKPEDTLEDMENVFDSRAHAHRLDARARAEILFECEE
jgi:hypothetical protein